MTVCARECTAREFLQLSQKKRLFAPEKHFTPDKEACDVRKNALLGRQHAFLAAYDEKRPAARLLLLDRGETAWFALPVLKNDAAAKAVVEKAVEKAREWGAAELAGPVSPDGSGFGIGAALPGSRADSAPWHPAADDLLVETLRESGMEPKKILLELGLPLTGENPYAGAQKWALERQGVRVCAMGAARRACEAAFAASQDAQEHGYAAFERIFARCAQIAPKMQAVVAFAKDAPVGWLMYVPGKNGRVLHMQICPEWRRTSCAAALLDKTWSMAREAGAKEALVSTIDMENGASLHMAENIGAARRATYALFSRKI